MKALAKNFGKLNQYVGEKFNTASKHEPSEDFKVLESQTEIRKENIEEIVDSCKEYVKTLEKKKGGFLTIVSLGDSLSEYGSDLAEDSKLGQALVKLGETESNLGKIQLEYASKFRDSFLSKLEDFLTDLKAYKQLRSKLENRRLDYDAKLNRLQKSKKENPELDEEMRTAQQKYEETLAELEEKMTSLNDCEPDHLELFYQFVDLQVEFFTQSATLLESAKSFIKDPSSRGNRVRKPRGSFAPASKSESGTATPLADRSAAVDNSPNLKTKIIPIASTLTSQEKKLCRANFSFVGENETDLPLQKGDIVTVLEEVDQGWWIGECNGRRGLFPVNYCAVMEPGQNQNPDPVLQRVPSSNKILPEQRAPEQSGNHNSAHTGNNVSSSNIILSNEQYLNILNNSDSIIVMEIYSKFVGPCEATQNPIKKWAQEFGDKYYRFIQAQNDEISQLEPYKMKSMPHFLVFHKGMLVDVIKGPNLPLLEKSLSFQVDTLKNGGNPVPYSKKLDVSTLKQVEKLETSNEPDLTVAPDGKENTLALIKPEAVSQFNDIKSVLLQHDFTILKEKLFVFTVDQAKAFYTNHENKPFFDNLIHYMTSGKVMGLVLQKENAVDSWRDLLGPTNPSRAKEERPNSLRAKYGTDSLKNGLHGSENRSEAIREITFVFNNDIKSVELKPNHSNFALLILMPVIVGTYDIPSYKIASITNLNASQRNLSTKTVAEADATRVNNIIYEILLLGWEIQKIDNYTFSILQAKEFFGDDSSLDYNLITSGSCLALQLHGPPDYEELQSIIGINPPDVVSVSKSKYPNSLASKYSVADDSYFSFISTNAGRAKRDIDFIFNSLTETSPVFSQGIEQIVIILKPDLMEKQKEVEQFMLQYNYKILKQKKMKFTVEQAKLLYEDHQGKPYFLELISFITSDEVVAYLTERENGLTYWRSIVGVPDPEKARETMPNSLRAKYGKDRIRNGFYSSDSSFKAQRDIELIFSEQPLAATRPSSAFKKESTGASRPSSATKPEMGSSKLAVVSKPESMQAIKAERRNSVRSRPTSAVERLKEEEVVSSKLTKTSPKSSQQEMKKEITSNSVLKKTPSKTALDGKTNESKQSKADLSDNAKASKSSDGILKKSPSKTALDRKSSDVKKSNTDLTGNATVAKSSENLLKKSPSKPALTSDATKSKADVTEKPLQKSSSRTSLERKNSDVKKSKTDLNEKVLQKAASTTLEKVPTNQKVTIDASKTSGSKILASKSNVSGSTQLKPSTQKPTGTSSVSNLNSSKSNIGPVKTDRILGSKQSIAAKVASRQSLDAGKPSDKPELKKESSQVLKQSRPSLERKGSNSSLKQ